MTGVMLKLPATDNFNEIRLSNQISMVAEFLSLLDLNFLYANFEMCVSACKTKIFFSCIGILTTGVWSYFTDEW